MSIAPQPVIMPLLGPVPVLHQLNSRSWVSQLRAWAPTERTIWSCLLQGPGAQQPPCTGTSEASLGVSHPLAAKVRVSLAMAQ